MLYGRVCCISFELSIPIGTYASGTTVIENLPNPQRRNYIYANDYYGNLLIMIITEMTDKVNAKLVIYSKAYTASNPTYTAVTTCYLV